MNKVILKDGQNHLSHHLELLQKNCVKILDIN